MGQCRSESEKKNTTPSAVQFLQPNFSCGLLMVVATITCVFFWFFFFEFNFYIVFDGLLMVVATITCFFCFFWGGGGGI